jgi:hypothetical protein
MSGPQKDDGPAVGAAGHQGLAQSVGLDFATSDADQKAFARVAAPLAIAGYALHELSCGGYLVARWDRTLHCPDLHAVRAFCGRAGVRI